MRARRPAPAEPKRPAKPAPAGDGSRGLAIWLFLGVLFFTLAYGGVILVKLQQERQAFITEAESSEARAAAFLAERVASRINEARAALAYAGADLETLPLPSLESAARSRLDRLAGQDLISEVALLLPDGREFTAGAGEINLRDAAGEALESPAGLAARTQDGAAAALILAVPAPLADGSVGAFVARLDTGEVLPAWGDNRIVALADPDGRALATHPVMDDVIGHSLAALTGLPQARIDALADGGGATSEQEGEGGPLTFAVSPVAGAGLNVYSLTAQRINRTAWVNTLIFHGLLFAAPLFVALGLSALALNQLRRLRSARAMLSASEQRLRVAIEGARCGVWDWDPAADKVIVTDSLARMLGLEGGMACSGKEFLSLLSAPDRERMRAAMRGAPSRGEVDLELLAAGTPVWMQMRGKLWDAAHGGSSGRIVGVAIDITERKGAQARVAAAENRLRAALESMSESFVLWDSRRRLVLWNRKFRDLFDFTEGMLKPGMAYEEVERAAARAITAIHAEIEDDETYEMELADGRWLAYSERPTADGGLVSVGADITALKKQGDALRERETQLRKSVENLKRSQARIAELARSYEEEKINAEQANRSKSEFLANMSHELRTPLNAINGFSEMMLREMFGPLGDERYVGYMKDIHVSGEHLLALINDILDMSKIEAGKMELHPEPVQPAEIVDQCIRIIRGRAEEKELQLRADVDDLPEIEADPRAFKQVLINLMSNAVKFTPEGGRVTVRGFLSGQGVAFQVSDTGIGIAKEDLPRLGRPFEQIESQHSKKHQGSGLGLALSKSLVEMHGGTLSIDSVVGEGTTTTVVIPINQADGLGEQPDLGDDAIDDSGDDEFVSDTDDALAAQG